METIKVLLYCATPVAFFSLMEIILALLHKNKKFRDWENEGYKETGRH